MIRLFKWLQDTFKFDFEDEAEAELKLAFENYKPKYRICKNSGGYYIERKTLLGWEPEETSEVIGFIYMYPTLEEAKQRLCEIKLDNNSQVVYEDL